jgi:hypothetical protein
MKKLGFLVGLLVLNLLTTYQTFAQLSIGVQGCYTKYISLGDSLGEFPITSANDLPSMAGGRLILDFGFRDKNAVQFAAGYHVGIEKIDGKMHSTSGNISGFDLSVRYKRYLIGSFNDYSGIYAMGGVSFTNNMVSFTVPDTAALAYTGEAKFYKDRSTQLISADLGVGAETLVMDKFNIFAEASFSTHINLFKNGTTIKTDPMMHFFRMSVGFRVPLGIGGDGTSTRPRRRRF